jgi:hypothetical protein
MNYIRHLNAFLFQHVKRDKRLTANHVSLYMALFQYWNFNRFQNPFLIKREDVISITGIGSHNTYLKCIKELHQFGYILYYPSKNRFEKSKIHIARLDGMKENLLKQLELFESSNAGKNPGDENERAVANVVPVNPQSSVSKVIPDVSQNCDPSGVKNETGTDANMRLLIKHKLINKREREKTLPPSDKIFLKNEQEENAISTRAAEKKFTRPEITQVLSFFKKNNYPDLEAKKFFNHYQSNGWLVGGVSPMSDWQSSAHKWMLNAEKFKNRTNHKTAAAKENYTNDKNFSEPL